MNPYEDNGYETQNDMSRTGSESPRDPDPAPEQRPRQSWQDYAPPRSASPYADSPYSSYGNPQQSYPPQPPKKKKAKNPSSGWGRRIVAAVLCLTVVGAGCGVTAWSVNSHWQKKTAQMEQRMDSMQKKLDSVASAGNGTSVSGSPMATGDSLTPAQVYAQNVRSVVSIHSITKPNQFGQVAEGSGSGFILTADGYVVTNYHVVEGADKVSVITSENTEYPAKIVGVEASNDVAVLKVEAEGLPAVTLGTSSDLIIGDMVVAIGNPLGTLAATQTVGYICGKDRDVSTGGAPINMLQTDAAINPGNSGGPLFNMKGEVVGITTAKYSGTTGSGASIEGIGFAIPIDDVMSMVEDLVQFGYVTGAYLGVNIQDMEPEVAAKYSLPVGAYVVSVVEDGSADRAGLHPKDIIVGLGDSKITNRTDLTRALRQFKAGDTSTITFYRGGSEIIADITFDEKPRDLNNPVAEEEIPMPSEGDYDEWYDFFNRFFGEEFG